VIALIMLDIASLLLASLASGLWYFERIQRIALEKRMGSMESTTVLQIKQVADHYMAEARALREQLMVERQLWRRELDDLGTRLARLQAVAQ
jgi:hypothetical protein